MFHNFVSLTLLCYVINLSVIIEIKVATALQFSDISLNVSATVDILSLFNSSSYLCIVSTDNDITSYIVKYCRNLNISVVLSSFFVSMTDKMCKSVVFVDMPSHEICLDVLNRTSDKRTVYVLDSGDDCSETVRLDLEQCHNTVEVLSVCLTDGSMTQLSPMWTTSVERHFTNTTVQQLLTRPTTVNMNGAKVTAAIIDYVPFLILKDLSKPEEFDGIEMQLLRELAFRLNFTLEFQIYEHWGMVEGNGSWKGGVGEAMQEHQADVAFANIWQIPDLYRIMDFGPALDKNKLTFLVRRPEQIEFRMSAFATIFKPFVWLFTFVGFVIVVVVYWALIRWGELSKTESWSSSVLTVFGHFLMTTSHSRPSDGSTRHTLVGWSVFSLLLTTSLSTGILSRLVLPIFSPRVDTIKQLVEGQYYWTVQYYARFKSQQSKASFFDFSNKWHYQFEKKYIYLSAEKIQERVKSEKKIAFLVQTFGDDFLVVNINGLVKDSALEEFRLAKESVSESKVTFGVQKNSPLLKPLRDMTNRFLMAGLMDLWKGEVIRRWPECDMSDLLEEFDDPTFVEHRPLQMDTFKHVMYFLLLGLGVSLIVFVVEISW